MSSSGGDPLQITTTSEPVSKPKKGRPKKLGGEGTQVRIETELATRARYVAAKNGVPLIDFLSDIIRPVVNREFLKAGKDITEGEK
jgi:hypothetical protein